MISVRPGRGAFFAMLLLVVVTLLRQGRGGRSGVGGGAVRGRRRAACRPVRRWGRSSVSSPSSSPMRSSSGWSSGWSDADDRLPGDLHLHARARPRRWRYSSPSVATRPTMPGAEEHLVADVERRSGCARAPPDGGAAAGSAGARRPPRSGRRGAAAPDLSRTDAPRMGCRARHGGAEAGHDAATRTAAFVGESRPTVVAVRDVRPRPAVAVRRTGAPGCPRGGTSPRCSQAAAVATRPRGVRASSPSRTRNGSATSSTVSRSSPTATASVLSPTGPPPKRRHSTSSTARSSRSSPERSTS